jgi:hypothetical protein
MQDLDRIYDERATKRRGAILKAIEYELEEAVSRAGAELHGFAVNLRPGEALLVLKVTLAGRRQVAFIGAETAGDALVKAVREARRDRLRWREDKYGGGE